jgi:uncharacterized membrane protein YbhN (UPF0104 family)
MGEEHRQHPRNPEILLHHHRQHPSSVCCFLYDQCLVCCRPLEEVQGLSAAYLGASVFDWKPVRIRKYSIRVPPFRLALGQAVIGPLNFAFVAACLYQGIAAVQDVGYPAVAASYVIANVAGMLSHVPGGLGVIESVILFLLGGGQVIGAVLVFRIVYFFVPLVFGGGAFLLIELGLLVRSHKE